jgi:SAM-dependent methyltransferase
MRPLGDGRQEGTPIVRHYWAQFLAKHAGDIRGRALEVGTTETIRRFGGDALVVADAIDVAPHASDVTVVADLTDADAVASDTYDCFVNQFTMHLIYDLDSALFHSVRILKPGGTLLVNFPSVEYLFARGLDMGTGAPLFVFWQFTPLQVANLLRRAGLAEDDFGIELYGNLFARVAYQMNMPAEQLTRAELDFRDGGHPLLICVRAVKPADWPAPRPGRLEPWVPQVAPARWTPETGHYGD